MLLWVSISLLTLVVTAVVVRPLLSKRIPTLAPDDDLERRLAVFRDRRSEIGRELAAGRLTEDEAAQARGDLLRQMAEELPPEALAGADRPAPQAIADKPSRLPLYAALLVAVLVPLLAFGVYQRVGSPELAIAQLQGTLPKRAGPHPQFDVMVADLEARLQADPKNGETWAVLAEAQRMVGNHNAAIKAFERAAELLPPNARLLADYAESAALVAGGEFAGHPTALLERALQIDPNDQKAVGLMGAARYHAGDLPQARRYIGQLLAGLPAGSPDAEQIRQVLTQIDAELAARGLPAGDPPGAPAAPHPPVSAPAAPHPPVPGSPSPAPSAQAPSMAPGTQSPPPAQAAQSGPVLRGTVSLAPALTGRLPASATLFVIARPAEGPRVPVAVLRVPAAALPMDFELGDANAMDPSRPLSSIAAVALEARLSASGDVIRQPGDLYSGPLTVAPNASSIAIVIDQVSER